MTLLVVALAYVLGILADRAADTLFEAFARDEPETTPKPSWKRMTVMNSSDGMSRFLEYQRSRWRIVRATVANLAISGPVAAAYVVVRADERAWALGLLACWVGLLLAAYAIATLRTSGNSGGGTATASGHGLGRRARSTC